MTTLAQPTTTINPMLFSALAPSFTLAHPDDEAAGRALQNALRHLATNPGYDFDGVELRIESKSRGRDVQHVTDGQSCTCEGSRHPWCLHRVEHHLITAAWALLQPSQLRAKIVEQVDPVEAREALERVETLPADEYGDVIPTAAPRQIVPARARKSYEDILAEADECF